MSAACSAPVLGSRPHSSGSHAVRCSHVVPVRGSQGVWWEHGVGGRTGGACCRCVVWCACVCARARVCVCVCVGARARMVGGTEEGYSRRARERDACAKCAWLNPSRRECTVDGTCRADMKPVPGHSPCRAMLPMPSPCHTPHAIPMPMQGHSHVTCGAPAQPSSCLYTRSIRSRFPPPPPPQLPARGG